jgi:hypothetical protein
LDVLNLWYENMRAAHGRIFQKFNPRKRALAAAESSSTTVWKARAARVDQAIQIKLHIASSFPSASLSVMGKCDVRATQRRKPHKCKGDWWTRIMGRHQLRLVECKCTLERGASPSSPASFPIDEELDGFEGKVLEQVGEGLAACLRDASDLIACVC